MGRPFFYGWLIVGVGTFAMFAATLTGGAGFSVFIAPMSQELGWSRSLLTGALSIGTIAGAILAPYVGRMIDQFGTRLVLTLCGLGIALTLTVVAGAHTELVFLLAYAASRTIDMGALNLSVTTAVSNWFVRRRGRALGIAMTGNAVGVMVLVPIIQQIIDGPGWRWAWLIIGGGSGLVLAVASAVVLRRRPEDIGLFPDGAIGEPAAATLQPRPSAAELEWTSRHAARSSAFWLLVLASCGMQVAISGLTVNQAPLLLENGLSPGAVAGAIGLYGLAWVVGTLVWGLVVERIAARISLGLTSLLVAACCAGAPFVREPAALVAFAVAYGFSNGAKESIDASVWADFFGRTAVGAIRGLSRPFVVGSGALGTFAGGLAFDLTGGYGLAALAFAVVALLGAGASLAAAPPATRPGRAPGTLA